MKNSPDTLAAIRRVFDKAASHICSAEPNCCRGCTLARQIPGLLDDIAELSEQLRLAGIDQWATEAELEYVRRDYECQVSGRAASRGAS